MLPILKNNRSSTNTNQYPTNLKTLNLINHHENTITQLKQLKSFLCEEQQSSQEQTPKQAKRFVLKNINTNKIKQKKKIQIGWFIKRKKNSFHNFSIDEQNSFMRKNTQHIQKQNHHYRSMQTHQCLQQKSNSLSKYKRLNKLRNQQKKYNCVLTQASLEKQTTYKTKLKDVIFFNKNNKHIKQLANKFQHSKIFQNKR